MKAIALTLALIIPTVSWASEFTGTVVSILDGDTVVVLNQQNQQVKIRLVEIDAPEKAQAFGTQSKNALSELCFKKSVVVTDKGLDRYKWTLGRLNCAGIDANAEQVKKGMAWAYRQYLTDQSIITLEDTAKASKVGLWVDSNPTPPWEFRHGSKNKSTSSSTNNQPSTSGYITGPRGGCYQLTASGKKHYVDRSLCN